MKYKNVYHHIYDAIFHCSSSLKKHGLQILKKKRINYFIIDYQTNLLVCSENAIKEFDEIRTIHHMPLNSLILKFMRY